jgi:C_GCAxxG_C_C family probable redox protein
VLFAHGTRSGQDREEALKLGAAFGAGMGIGETCGAVTGALMVIGLRQSRGKRPGILSRETARDFARKFVERFTERNGTTRCKELLGCDVGTPEGLKAVEKGKYFKKRCPKFVADAAEILDELAGE